MSAPAKQQVRVRDIEPDRAQLLERIHALAAESVRQRQAIPTSEREVNDWKHLVDQLDAIHGERDLTEITARDQGIPNAWIDLARRHGIEGKAWTGDQLLPPATRTWGRRTSNRVMQDAKRLAHMAAVSTVRDHLRAAAGITTEADPAAAQRFQRNFHALRTRAVAIASFPGTGQARVAHAFAAASDLLNHEISQYLTYTLTDLEAMWQPLTSRAIASDIRRSLKSLQIADPGTSTGSHQTLVPTANALLARARVALAAAATPDSGSGAAIEAAISAGLGESAALDWVPDIEAEGLDSATAEVQHETGPDPPATELR
ncbi:hypothetical protein [Nocardia sp. XZ_19_385]|uniref:hypothetical protein n=1 Tax=Nocardia sp. XZ_19_385 TaxID=2769488 RepID=UPI00188FB184|nr:hypothetical protein [Nocardia sp. XZ_19_385]